MKDDSYRFEVVSDEASFVALGREWRALWEKARGRYFQRFDVCLLAWLHVARPRHRRLRCIVLREDGELKLVWPLVAYRRVLWTYLLPLGPDAADYTSVLVEDGPDAQARIEAAWRFAREHCHADFVHLPYVNEGSELHRVALREPHILGLSRHDSWIARLRDESDWAGYSRSLGTMHGKRPGQLERRLAKEGRAGVRMLDPSDIHAIEHGVRDMLAWKREWAERTGKKGEWLFSPRYEAFLVAMLTHQDDDAEAREPARMNVVTLNDVPIAAAIVSHGNPLANAIIGSFDPKYAKFGAGSIALEHCVKWALEQRYDVDFGVGPERFKAYWSRGNRAHAWTIRIAGTLWGLAAYRTLQTVRGLHASLKHAHEAGHRGK